jgi:hypothetical protein
MREREVIKIYDVATDEYREATQLDIDMLMAIKVGYGLICGYGARELENYPNSLLANEIMRIKAEVRARVSRLL